METPLISIIIPTYKRAAMLHRAIISVLEQTYSNIEVLVVSDNEPDDEYTSSAQATVDSFNDRRVRLILQEKHINGAVARNIGINASKGKYISFLDDDDYYDNNKIERQYDVLSELDDTWGGVCCRYKVYKKGRLVEVSPLFKSGYVYKDIIMRLIKTQTNSLLLRRDALFDVGLFDEKLLRHQDVQLLARFSSKYKLFCQDEFLNNLDQDDNLNRLKPEKVVQIKKDFVDSVKDLIDSFSHIEKFRYKLLTRFDIGALYIADKQYLKGISYLLTIVLSPIAFVQSCKKVIEKKQMRKVARELANKNMHHYRSI
jgi:glycosyltransferase involved in cell wall biosynthesis